MVELICTPMIVKPMACPELGMVAIFKITGKDFPAFILVDDKGTTSTPACWAKHDVSFFQTDCRKKEYALQELS